MIRSLERGDAYMECSVLHPAWSAGKGTSQLGFHPCKADDDDTVAMSDLLTASEPEDEKFL